MLSIFQTSQSKDPKDTSDSFTTDEKNASLTTDKRVQFVSEHHDELGDTDHESYSEDEDQDEDLYEMTRPADCTDITEAVWTLFEGEEEAGERLRTKKDPTEAKNNSKKARQRRQAMAARAAAEEKQSSGRAFSFIELLQQTKLLSMFLQATEWQEDLFEGSVRVDLPGINANEMSWDERRFVEAKLLDTFNSAMSKVGYTVVSSYFSRMAGEEDATDANYVGRGNNRWNDFVEDITCGGVGIIKASDKSDKDALIPPIPDIVISKLNKFSRETCAVLGLDSPLKLKLCFWIANKVRVACFITLLDEF